MEVTGTRTARRLPFSMVLAAIVSLCAGCFHREVVIETDPLGASVWMGEQLLGAAPQAIKLRRKQQVQLRISHPACLDRAITIEGDRVPESGRILVQLSPKPTFSLSCTTDPPGAEVFLDGEYRGRTPLQIAPLQPGTVELTFRAKEREQTRHVVELSLDNPSPSVHVKLESTIEKYYRQQIETQPLELAHYVDLAHHLVLEKQFEQAMTVFDTAIRIALEHPNLSAGRLWSEVDRVVSRQYAYGSDADVAKARRLMNQMLTTIFDSHKRDNQDLYVNYIIVLHAAGDRAKARKVFDVALTKFPDSRQLKQLSRRLRF